MDVATDRQDPSARRTQAESRPEDPEDPAEQRSIRLRRLAAAGSISLAAVLVVAKLAAALITDSVAVLSTLLDSMADLAAASITVICVRQSVRPPSHAFRFGRGKAEPLSALGQAAFIAGSGLFIIIEAITRLLDPQPLAATEVGMAVMVLALVLTGSLVAFQRYVVRETESPAIAADSLNYMGDLVTGMSVLVTLVVVEQTGVVWLDPLVGLAVALYLLRNAASIGHGAVDMLLDRELPTEERRQIKRIVLDNQDVQGLHDLRTRSAGARRFIELHLEIDGGLSLKQSHEITDRIEAALMEEFPSAEVIIHQEPAGLKDRRLDDRLKADS
jgi:ferrous-iron efflux pump FieF